MEENYQGIKKGCGGRGGEWQRGRVVCCFGVESERVLAGRKAGKYLVASSAIPPS